MISTISQSPWRLKIWYNAWTFCYRVRVANELGAGNGKGAKFATIVSVAESTVIGLIFCALIVIFHDKIAIIFSSSRDVLGAVDDLAFLLAVTILLNSVQPVLSGEFSFLFPFSFIRTKLYVRMYYILLSLKLV